MKIVQEHIQSYIIQVLSEGWDHKVLKAEVFLRLTGDKVHRQEVDLSSLRGIPETGNDHLRKP